MDQTEEQGDLLETIIGVVPGSALSALRALRPDIVRHTQGSHDVLLSPTDPGGLSLVERALIARRTAELSHHGALAAHYRTLHQQRGEPAAGPRCDAILAHVARVTTAPRTATPAALAALSSVGLSATDIVALTQIVAFVSYQVRAAAGLALLTQKEHAA